MIQFSMKLPGWDTGECHYMSVTGLSRWTISHAHAKLSKLTVGSRWFHFVQVVTVNDSAQDRYSPIVYGTIVESLSTCDIS